MWFTLVSYATSDQTKQSWASSLDTLKVNNAPPQSGDYSTARISILEAHHADGPNTR